MGLIIPATVAKKHTGSRDVSRGLFVAAWGLTGAVSPRASVRVAAVDGSGEALNLYTDHHRIDREAPSRPWAVYLAGRDLRYRLLAFDLDAKTPAAAAAAARDADVLSGILRDAGMESVVCESGPSGGRHVWVGLAESVDAATVATIARLVRHVCPTLDLAPLANATTGCVRPPGAPHRSGGRSVVLEGSVATLTAPTATAAHIQRLVERLAHLVDVIEPDRALDPRTPLPVDEHGRTYLPGPRRTLPASAQAALAEDATAADGTASAVLWRVLVGAAYARWRHADVAELVATSPGLEHVRTQRAESGTRRPRPAQGDTSAVAVLRRQWDKAVAFVANSRQTGSDPTFDPRADAIAAHVRAVQARAQAAGGRWATRTGPADRRVLDTLCLLALQALSDCVEADIRRLALLAGIGRETARTGLLRLASEGWISQARAAEGPHGAHWKIGPDATIHSLSLIERSQADPRPAGAGAAERTLLMGTLTKRLAAAAHDCFTPRGGLGHLAGNIYARATEDLQTIDDFAQLTGTDRPTTRKILTRLTAAGVLVATKVGWRRRAQDYRRAVAVDLGVEGRLLERARHYRLERELWAWWQQEEAWMRAPRRTAASRRPGPGQLALLPDIGTNHHGAHPRRRDGRADYRTARALLVGGALNTQVAIA